MALFKKKNLPRNITKFRKTKTLVLKFIRDLHCYITHNLNGILERNIVIFY